MAQAQNKTTENDNNVNAFLDTVLDAAKREDSRRIVALFSKQSGFEPKMWGTAIIGFGHYHYKYASGREGDAPLAGFSPRKNNIALYFSDRFENRETLLAQLGKHKTAKVCVYIKKLDDIDPEILKKMIDASIKDIQTRYP
jgi:hypothetical protein